MKTTALVLAAIALLGFVQSGYAQHKHEHDRTFLLRTPASIEMEHDAIHNELSALTKGNDATSAAARAVAEALHEHFEAEEEYAMPQLGVLRQVSNNEPIHEAGKVIRLSNELRRKMPEMLREHGVIRERVRLLREAAVTERRQEAVEFADRLALHAQNEEEILYPAALLVGEILTLRETGK